MNMKLKLNKHVCVCVRARVHEFPPLRMAVAACLPQVTQVAW
jgi:hypothetical protein